MRNGKALLQFKIRTFFINVIVFILDVGYIYINPKELNCMF